MRLSVNVENLLWKYPLEKCAQIYKAAGFDAVDFPLFDMVRDACGYNGENYREIAARDRKRVEDAGLVINQTHAPFNFAYNQWANESIYKEVVYPRLVRSIEISALLGADVVVMHPLHHFVHRGHEEEIFNLNMEFYRSLIPYCKEYGIKVGVENMWGTDRRRNFIVHDTCSRKEEFVRYIDTLDSEYMVACLDTGHIGLPEQDDEVEDVILALGHDRLGALHVHDNTYKTDDHNLPFHGRLNWQNIPAALGKIDYRGDFTYEVTTVHMKGADDAFVPIGAKYMADIGRHLIERIDHARLKL